MIEGTSHGTYHFLSSPSRLHAVTASCWCTPTGLQQSIYSQMHPSCRARDKEGESQHHYFNSRFVSPSEAQKVSFTLRNTKRTRWNRWNSYLQYQANTTSQQFRDSISFHWLSLSQVRSSDLEAKAPKCCISSPFQLSCNKEESTERGLRLGIYSILLQPQELYLIGQKILFSQ